MRFPACLVCLLAAVLARCAQPLGRVSENGVIDLDEKVQEQNPRVLEDSTPCGSQQRIREIALLGRSEDIEFDAQLAHRAPRRAVSLTRRRPDIPL